MFPFLLLGTESNSVYSEPPRKEIGLIFMSWDLRIHKYSTVVLKGSVNYTQSVFKNVFICRNLLSEQKF